MFSTALESLLHGHDVIRIAFVNLENRVQRVCGIYRVSCPGYVSEIVFLSFINGEIDSEPARLHHIYTVFQQSRIPVARFIEGADEGLLVIQIFFFIELLAAEEVIDLGRLGFLHRLGKFEITDMVIADEVDGLDTDSRSSLDRIVHADRVLDDGIFLDLRLDLHIEEAFSLIISLDDVHGCPGHVVGVFAASLEVQALLQILLLTALDSGESPSGHSRTLLNGQFEKHRILRCVQ